MKPKTAQSQVDSKIPSKVFMLGIGGMGMAPLAIYLAQAGCRVCGFDDAPNPAVLSLLNTHGIELVSHLGELPERGTLIIRSSAILLQNEFLKKASGQHFKIIRRGEMLAQIAKQKRLVAVAGSHGKTTTTAMMVFCLKQMGFAFSYIIGGLPRNDESPAGYDADSEFLLAEIDESDGTIDLFEPNILVLLNIDWDHADVYRDETALRATFSKLVERTQDAIILPHVLECVIPSSQRSKGVLISEECDDFRLANADFARHAVERISGLPCDMNLVDFPGVLRRQDILYSSAHNWRLIADYAHHPTEISALLHYLRRQYRGPIYLCFQPHRFSRTQALAKDFATCLMEADGCALLPVYAASESPSLGGGSELILKHMDSPSLLSSRMDLLGEIDNFTKHLDSQGGTFVCVGAGDIACMAEQCGQDLQLVEKWREHVSPDTQLNVGEHLAKKTTFRVGGCARFYAEPSGPKDLLYLLQSAREQGIAYFLLGRGSNLIVSDTGFDGLVIHLTQAYWRSIEIRDDGKLWAAAGLRLKELCGFAARHGVTGLEFLEGIPGSLGGALRMNAGAMGKEMFDVIESVEFIRIPKNPSEDPKFLGIEQWNKTQFSVSYRRCAELLDGVACAAVFSTTGSAKPSVIRSTMQDYAHIRKGSQPRLPSSGCIFKNPLPLTAGKLIDELGLKGMRVGDAQVSEIHANFIVNQGKARSSDVFQLIRQIRDVVYQKRSILLEPEVLLLGTTWSVEL